MRVFFGFIFGFIFLCGNSGFSQQAKPKRFTAALMGTVVLRDVADKYNAEVSSMEMPDPDASTEQKKLQEVKSLIKKRFPNTSRQGASGMRTSSSVMPPTVALSFVADSSPQIPPDNYMAVSNGQKAMTVMNGTVTVHDATTGAYLYRKTLLPFTASVGLNNTPAHNVNYRYDPKVVYDPVADRFICVMLNSTDSFNWIIAGFSTSNDPAGGWNFYKFFGDYTGDTTWFDYPAISITQTEFFLTGNKIFFDSSWQGGFHRSLIYQMRKQDGYDGNPLLTYQIWDSIQYNNHFLRCLYPLNPSDAVLGPSQYFLSNRNFDLSNDTVFIVTIPDTIGSASATLTVTPVAGSGATYGAPPDARQPDTSLTLATNDARVLGGFIKDNEIQFVNASVDPSNGCSAVYHGVIDNFTTTPVMTGQLFSIDTLDFGYPNISYAGHMGSSIQSIISFNYSGPHTYPGYGAILYDGANLSDMLVIKSGDSTINMLAQKEQRWGDYSGSQPDWTTLGSVWVEGIYGRKNRQYGNFMAKLASPYPVGVPTVPQATAAPSVLYPNPGLEYISFEFNVAKEQAFSFIIYDVAGKVVDKIADTYCHDGKNVIRFNILPLQPGNYFLKAIGANGESIEVHSFIRK